MARHLRAAIGRVKTQLLNRQQLPADVDQLARKVGHQWRECPLTPAVTCWMFLLQVLNGNAAMTTLRHITGIATAASSYCEARMRLPLVLFAELFDAVAQRAAEASTPNDSSPSPATLLNGRRVLLGDATTFSMPDTPALRDHFGYPAGQRQGCGFPMGKLLGVIDAMTGCIMTALGCPLFSHEAREMLTLCPLLRRGDVLVADRAFCSFAQIAILQQHGVDVVMRLHQRRAAQWMKDYLESWSKPPRRPQWMSEAMWSALPQELTIRIVRYAVPRKASRTRWVYVATTMLDRHACPAQTIARLYGHRWNIETCFNQLKTHAKMNTLKSETPGGVIKELIMFLIVWNLIRMTMARFAQAAGVSIWRVSFLDALRCLCVLLRGPVPAEMKLVINPDRPGRWEPRKLKRRNKEYDLLTEPRRRLKAKQRERCG